MEFDCKVFWACFDKVNSSEYSVNRVLLFGYLKGFPLLMTTTHKVFADLWGRYKYAYSFILDSTRPHTESGSDIVIMDKITLLHKIKCLQLPFDPSAYVTHDVAIFFCDICEDIRVYLDVWGTPNDLRAGVNMNSGISFIHGVLNVGPQSEKWNGSVFGSASPIGLSQFLHFSSGHSIVVGVDDYSIRVLWIILEICIRLFCWLIMMLEVLAKKAAVVFKKVAPEVEIVEDFNGEQNKRATIPFLQTQMLHEQEVDQLEKFHLPLCDQMLLLEGANTIIDALETVGPTREVLLKAPTIEDIDKMIVVVSDQMEIIKILQEEIFVQLLILLKVSCRQQITERKAQIMCWKSCWMDIVEKLLQMCSMNVTEKLVGLPMN
ncbi:hypothetical protein R3W88_011506 [Solanum pinnatisectum]|uniref:Uncharacterized protein n=1 Tax=Solanum pinnatisectum TaxID=50273 RepID=A0AAV9L7M8_9SOLN|nr:hypothetical protein R3W88_011506 [Solanum pinnatisectum]